MYVSIVSIIRIIHLREKVSIDYIDYRLHIMVNGVDGGEEIHQDTEANLTKDKYSCVGYENQI